MTEIKVINAGLCRTGTMSTRQAFIDMGFQNCYHMQECVALGENNIWIKCFEENCFDKAIEMMSKGNFQSGTDLPFCAIFDIIMEKYPDAKIVLNVRDDPQKWVNSWRNTVYKICTLPIYTEIFRLCPAPLYYMAPSHNQKFHDLFWARIIKNGNSVSKLKVPENKSTSEMTDQEMCQLYLNWIEYVKMVTPSDRLLIFNVKEGIEPLASFLNVGLEKNYSMPNINDTNQFNELVSGLKIGGLSQNLGLAGLGALGIKKIRGPLSKISKIMLLPFSAMIGAPIAISIMAQKFKTSGKLLPFSLDYLH